MANTKISGLPVATTMTGTEVLPVVQGGVTTQATVAQLLALVIAGASSNLDTFFEVATRFGLDEATVTTLQALVAGKATSLTTTAVKTAAYTASANEIVPCDTTAGSFTVTLPTAPPDKTRQIIKLVASVGTPNPVTIALGGSDVFNKAGGSTTGSLSLLNQALAVQYTAATGIWTVTGDDLPLSQLDARYVTPASVSATYLALTTALLDWGYSQSYRLVSATRDANEAITTASVVWPDGATGTFTTDTASTAFPGAIDAYHVTHVLAGVTKTVTQSAVTRDAGGAVTAQPALTVA